MRVNTGCLPHVMSVFIRSLVSKLHNTAYEQKLLREIGGSIADIRLMCSQCMQLYSTFTVLDSCRYDALVVIREQHGRQLEA